MPPKRSKTSKKSQNSKKASKTVSLNNLKKIMSPKKWEDQVILGLVLLIFMSNTLLNVFYQKFLELGLFLASFVVMVVLTNDLVISLAVAMILSIVVPKLLPSNRIVMAEGFQDVELGPQNIDLSGNSNTGGGSKHQQSSEQTVTETQADNPQTDQPQVEQTPPATEQTPPAKEQTPPAKEQTPPAEPQQQTGGGAIQGFGDDDDSDVNNNYIDIGSSFLEAYKTLKPGQIEAMSNDTKELLNTQKSLISAMDSLAPVVKEGHKMLESFKGFFPNDKNFANLIPDIKK